MKQYILFVLLVCSSSIHAQSFFINAGMNPIEEQILDDKFFALNLDIGYLHKLSEKSKIGVAFSVINNIKFNSTGKHPNGSTEIPYSFQKDLRFFNSREWGKRALVGLNIFYQFRLFGINFEPGYGGYINSGNSTVYVYEYTNINGTVPYEQFEKKYSASLNHHFFIRFGYDHKLTNNLKLGLYARYDRVLSANFNVTSQAYDFEPFLENELNEMGRNDWINFDRDILLIDLRLSRTF